MFYRKVVHVYEKSRTCFRKKSYVFFEKHVRVFLRTFTAVIRSKKRVGLREKSPLCR